MNSSILAGERRRASARRGGMTVLGKVTVPKPINLPSQRLENRGWDPNVEIVPRGTVSWGSRSSSSGSSLWTSSSLSPSTDGGTVSPSHLSGRPSSGGSGTRPSTSASDRTHDPTPNVWASNARPSSASGTLSSSQTSSSSLRPRSAENRPNSSQLSRFAEPVSKSSAAWGSSVSAERLGVKSLKEDSFSLSSQDFPTLGSEKDNSAKNVKSDCSPSSASGIVQAKEDNKPHADTKHRTVNTWSAESSSHTEDDIHPSMEKWQGDPHQYFNPKTAPQHFEGWRAPPMNGQACGWYGGHPCGPAFGAHVPPSGFPMEPFSYQQLPIPPPPLTVSQPVPPPGPQGPQSKNGDLYRPQMLEAYPRPGMSFRPSFYPGPPGPMPFEGYYGPPMGYCNGERDIPYMGKATGPHVSDDYLAPVPDMSSSHGGHPRVDSRGKGKFSSQDGDGWRRKPMSTESSSAVTAPNNGTTPTAHFHGPNYVVEATKNSVIDLAGKAEGDLVEVRDSADIQAQRAKMREIAKQRALQLQREEEERVREQKAKAHAKLEELDRRKIASEAANQNVERTSIVGDINVEQEEPHSVIGTVIAELKTNESGFNLVLSPAVASVETDSGIKRAGKSVEVTILPQVMPQKCSLESNGSSLPRNEDSEDGSTKKVVVSQSDDGVISRNKPAGYNQKQNNMSQKSFNENTVSNTTFEVQKDHTHAAIANMAEPPRSDSNVPKSPNTAVESSRQRRRINRSNEPKPQPDESPSAPALPLVTSDITHGNESINDDASNSSVSNLGAFVSTGIEPNRSVQNPEMSSSLPSEESQRKVSDLRRPHLSRRIPKNQQGHRFTGKHHGCDTVVWAPKAKVSDEVSQPSVQESANSVKGDNVAHNSLKGKRTEMERYIPKPQLAQQGSAAPSSSVNSFRSNEGACGEQSKSAISVNLPPVSSAPENVENIRFNLEINVGDSSNNKKKNDPGSWRQHGPIDSSHMMGVLTGPQDSSQVKDALTGSSPVSEPTKEIQQSQELLQPGTSVINKENAESKISGGSHTSIDTSTAAVNKYPSAKDQGAIVRGKRHPPRGPRRSGHNLDRENASYSEVDGSYIQSSALNGNQMDTSTTSKENRSFGERTFSHWQRKSSPSSANNQQGNRNAGSESVTLEANRISRKDKPQHKVQVLPQQDKESSNSSQPLSQPGQSVKVKSNISDDAVTPRHQNFDREKKPASVKGHPYSPNQDTFGFGESPHPNTNDQHEHNVTSGSRRTGRQNNRPVRGHDARSEWSSWHDNRPHIPAFRGRQRQNVHLEYQPIGPLKGHKTEKIEELGDGGADSIDQRHRESGQGHSKRGGNFYRR